MPAQRKRKLTEGPGLAPDALPGERLVGSRGHRAGLLVDLVEDLRPEHCVGCDDGRSSKEEKALSWVQDFPDLVASPASGGRAIMLRCG